MEGEQFEIDLGDKFQMWEKIAKDLVEAHKHNWSVTVYMYPTSDDNVFWLGTRTNGPVETDHDWIYQIDLETAKYLLDRVPGLRYR